MEAKYDAVHFFHDMSGRRNQKRETQKMKEGAGVSQRPYTRDPQTQTAVWGWPEGGGMRQGA